MSSKIRSRYALVTGEWTEVEDRRAMDGWRDDVSLDNIAARLGRSRESVRGRLLKLLGVEKLPNRNAVPRRAAKNPKPKPKRRISWGWGGGSQEW